MESGALKDFLKGSGATLVGVGDVRKALSREIVHLDRAVAIAVNRNLNFDTVRLLERLQRLTEDWIRPLGFKSLSIPPDSDRRRDKLITKLYPLVSHKTAATCSGLGWIGKNGLIINRQYGCRLSWATVLTNAPFRADEPVSTSECGDCDLCVKHCPSGALIGRLWSMRNPLEELVAYEKCRSLKEGRTELKEKPNCGLCATICPYSRHKYSMKTKGSACRVNRLPS